MLNWIWFGMIVVGIVVAAFSGKLDAVSGGLISSAQVAVMDLALPLGGVMTFMLGMMRLVEKSGMIVLLSRAVRPLMTRLFPEVPPEHPAMGSMMLNMASNFLGAGNASTPLGLKAMAQLETLNPYPGIATNAQVMFLALNTGALTLISTTALSIMKKAGSANPTAIIVPCFIAALCASITAALTAKAFQRFAPIRPQDASAPKEAKEREEKEIELFEPKRLSPKGRLIMVALFLVLAASYGLTVSKGAGAAQGMGPLEQFVSPLSALALPAFLLIVVVYAALSGLKVFEDFIEGAKEGIQTALRIIPFLVAMLVAIGVLRNSGAIGYLTDGVRWTLAKVGVPQTYLQITELLPMALMRPLSGSGSSAVLADLIKTHGPDSFLGRAAATMYGSTETTFYVLAVYFGSVGIKRSRHALAAGLCADAAGMSMATLIWWKMTH